MGLYGNFPKAGFKVSGTLPVELRKTTKRLIETAFYVGSDMRGNSSGRRTRPLLRPLQLSIVIQEQSNPLLYT